MIDASVRYLQRKACLVMGDHMNHISDVNNYSIIVIRETICIALTVEVLHELEEKAADVVNTCVIASNREKI